MNNNKLGLMGKEVIPLEGSEGLEDKLVVGHKILKNFSIWEDNKEVKKELTFKLT